MAVSNIKCTTPPAFYQVVNLDGMLRYQGRRLSIRYLFYGYLYAIPYVDACSTLMTSSFLPPSIPSCLIQANAQPEPDAAPPMYAAGGPDQPPSIVSTNAYPVGGQQQQPYVAQPAAPYEGGAGAGAGAGAAGALYPPSPYASGAAAGGYPPAGG